MQPLPYAVQVTSLISTKANQLKRPNHWLAALGVTLLLTQASHALTIIDNFTDSASWGVPMATPDSNLSVGNSRMNYVSTSTGDNFAAILRNAPLLPTTQDWSMKVNVHLDPFTLTTEGQFSDVFLGICKNGDFSNNAMFEFGRGVWGSHNGNYIQANMTCSGVHTPNLFEAWNLNLAAPESALRMDYSATNHTITYYFDADGATGGYNWVAQGNADISSGAYNMNLTATDTFTIFLTGSSSDQVIIAGQAYLSNLEITVNQTSSGPSVTTRTATSISLASATLNGTVNPNGVATTARFEYGLTASYGSMVGVTLSPDNGVIAQAVSANLDGLRSGTTYHYRVSATNSDGTSSGVDMTFATTSSPLLSSVPTGAMVSARYNHRAMLLANGKVLVAGGRDPANAVLSSAELYEPTTGLWSPTGTMNTARFLPTATLLPNGKVLVAGGPNNAYAAISSAELYDPASGLWTPTGTMRAARSFSSATLLSNGKVLVAGGWNATGALIPSAELYDPATGLWTNTGAMRTARDSPTATLLASGKVLVAGGFDSGYLAISSTELYDPATGLWTSTGAMGTPRCSHSAVLLPNDKVLVTGGYDSEYLSISSAELYDPATGLWTNTGAMHTARDSITATLLPGGNVLVAGGREPLSSVELYDPAIGLWTPTGEMGSFRSLHTVALMSNGKVLVAGGYDGVNVIASAELYGVISQSIIGVLDGSATLTDGSPTPVSFGSSAVGNSVSKILTITNTGSNDLTLGAITKDGANADNFSVGLPDNSTVTAGGSTTLTVTFAPVSTGTKTAAIHISSNVPGTTNPFDINISGTGATAAALFDFAVGNSSLSGTDAAALATPFHDGVSNILKYAFNMDLAHADTHVMASGAGTSGLPCISHNGTGASATLKIEFLRRKGSGLIYTPERSSTLSGFVTMSGTQTVTSIDAQWERVSIEEASPPTPSSSNFARVRVLLP